VCLTWPGCGAVDCGEGASGGALVASVIGRVLRLGARAIRGEATVATARLRAARTSVSVPSECRTVWTPTTVRPEFRSAFERAGFRLRSLRALGLLSPPPYMFAFSHGINALSRTLQTSRIESRHGRDCVSG